MHLRNTCTAAHLGSYLMLIMWQQQDSSLIQIKVKSFTLTCMLNYQFLFWQLEPTIFVHFFFFY